jgi:hypothetical protein
MTMPIIHRHSERSKGPLPLLAFCPAEAIAEKQKGRIRSMSPASPMSEPLAGEPDAKRSSLKRRNVPAGHRAESLRPSARTSRHALPSFNFATSNGLRARGPGTVIATDHYAWPGKAGIKACPCNAPYRTAVQRRGWQRKGRTWSPPVRSSSGFQQFSPQRPSGDRARGRGRHRSRTRRHLPRRRQAPRPGRHHAGGPGAGRSASPPPTSRHPPAPRSRG